MRLRLPGIAAICALVLCCTASSSLPASGAEPPGPALAARDARALLGRLDLPPGATPSDVDPTGEQAALGAPGLGPPATPNAVDVSAWWRVPLGPSETLRWLREHPPARSTEAAQGRGTLPSGAQAAFYAFSWPQVRNRLTSRWLVVTVVGRPDGSSAVRADGQSVWVVPRPPWRIPRAGSVSVKALPTSPTGPSFRRTRDPAQVARLARILDELPLVQPGFRSCPPERPDQPVAYRLNFRAAHSGHIVASARVSLEGCRLVTLAIRGRPRLLLEGADPDLLTVIRSVLGPAKPRSRVSPRLS